MLPHLPLQQPLARGQRLLLAARRLQRGAAVAQLRPEPVQLQLLLRVYALQVCARARLTIPVSSGVEAHATCGG